MAQNTNCKYLNPIYGMYNPIYEQLNIVKPFIIGILGHNCFLAISVTGRVNSTKQSCTMHCMAAMLVVGPIQRTAGCETTLHMFGRF